MDEPPSHYFAEAPTAASSPRVVDLVLPDVALRLQTDRGVFGYGAVDTATKLLLLEGPPPPDRGHLLDLGCGTGAIALALARRAPQATVWAVDVNERARDLCRRNAGSNGIDNVEVAAPDQVPAEVRFDAIWSNPPIRVGKAALHALLRRWLARLTADGRAQLVVGKHLGADSLQAWLVEQGHPTRRYASRRGFRLLEVGPRRS
jgi:16S rRNA (guanine1207-N2)-methyltransferase